MCFGLILKRILPNGRKRTGLSLSENPTPKKQLWKHGDWWTVSPLASIFSRLIYDDVVTRESVSSPDMIFKTTEAWALSINLGTREGIKRYIGTRYHFNDTYREMMKREAAVAVFIRQLRMEPWKVNLCC